MEFTYLQWVLTALAIVGSVIAFLQWRTNHIRLKHELFDRRFEQFNVVKRFLGTIRGHGKFSHQEEQDYLVGTKGAEFIFDKKISKLIDKDIWELAGKLNALNAEIEGTPPSEEKNNYIKKRRDIFNELEIYFMNLDSHFSRFLKLPRW